MPVRSATCVKLQYLGYGRTSALGALATKKLDVTCSLPQSDHVSLPTKALISSENASTFSRENDPLAKPAKPADARTYFSSADLPSLSKLCSAITCTWLSVIVFICLQKASIGTTARPIAVPSAKEWFCATDSTVSGIGLRVRVSESI